MVRRGNWKIAGGVKLPSGGGQRGQKIAQGALLLLPNSFSPPLNTLEICVKKMDSKYQSVTIFISLDSKYQSFIDLYLDSKFRFPRHNCNKFNRIKFLILNFFFLTHLHNYSHILSFKLV